LGQNLKKGDNILVGNSDKTMDTEVISHLDSFFDEDESADPSFGETSPFAELNAIVLSIDWEITDDIMQKFITETNRLRAVFKSDEVINKLLQLHGSVGKYISSKKVNAHPDSIKLLHSIFVSLQKLTHTPQIDRDEKKQILTKEINSFKALKSHIISTKSTQPGITKDPVDKKNQKEALPGVSTMQDTDATITPVLEEESGEAFASAINDLKQLIRNEFAALRKDMKL
jgi:flagellar biosynthesis regulator FlbT